MDRTARTAVAATARRVVPEFSQHPTEKVNFEWLEVRKMMTMGTPTGDIITTITVLTA
jgi:hypothetical protein